MPVMRRQSDGWVNATHILKLARFDKPQRTRILEREVQTGTHEKVQGGYGKFQGTWVPLERARELARQFGVLATLEPLFQYTPSSVPPPNAPKHSWRPRAREKSTIPIPVASVDDGQPATKKRRGRAPAPKAEPTYSASAAIPTVNPTAAVQDRAPRSLTIHGDPRYQNERDDVAERTSQSFTGQAPQAAPESESDGGFDTSEDEPMDAVDDSYSAKLLDYFIRAGEETTEIPDFLVHPPRGFNVNNVIDDEGHTAFHWACAMGDLRIVDVLLSIGADIAAVNNNGETPLIRAVTFTNNYDRNTFPRLVEILHDTTFYEDQDKRTVLHHIAATTSSKSKLKAAKYYLDTLLATLGGQPLDSFINRADSPNGDTALHITARNGAVKCNRILLQYGANQMLRNNSGRTAQEYMSEHAIQKQHQLSFTSHYNGNSTGTPGQHRDSVRTPPPLTIIQHQPVITRFEDNAVVANEDFMLNGLDLPSTIINKIRPQLDQTLSELSKSYLVELKEKNSDWEQMNQLLEKVNKDIMTTKNDIEQQELRLGSLAQSEQTLEQLTSDLDSRFERLRAFIERTQSRDLARLVEKEESNIEIKQDEEDPKEVEEVAAELSALQEQRVELVDEVLKLYANAGAGSRMRDYRRLLSLSCGVGVEEIDELIDGISQALRESAANG